MPNVAGKKFPYTKAGMAAAKKMADKKVKPKRKSLIKKGQTMKTPASAIKKVAEKQKASASEKKKKSLIKVVGQSRSILSPYGRDEYLDHFNGLIKKGMSHKSAHSATIKFMMDSSAFEMQERNSD